MNSFFLIILLVLAFEVDAQNTRKVYIQVSPNESFIEIDGKVIEVSKKPIPFILDMEEGTHIIKVWAPKYKQTVDTFSIEGNKRLKYFKRLVDYTEDYQLYRKELKAYRKLKSEKIISNICIPLANIGILWTVWGQEKSKELAPLKAKTDFYRMEFANSIYQRSIDMNRVKFERFRDDYNKKRKELYLRRSIGIPIFVASSYISYKFLKKLNKRKREKPTFIAKENPFVLNDIDVLPSLEGLTFNLKFKF